MSVLAGGAHAQVKNSSTIAEQLFKEARDLAKANHWAEACTKFEASLHHEPVLGTRLNLATCYEHIGKLASAWSIYRESIALAKKANDAKRAAYAQKHADALEPRLAKLVISAPATQPAGFVVTRDGTPLDGSALGIALYVDAGPHGIAASAPGFEAFTHTVTLSDGKTETVEIPTLAAIPAPAPEAPKPAPEAPKPGTQDHAATTEPVVVTSPPHSSATITPATESAPAARVPSTRKYVGIGVGAAGVAATGIGLLFGAKASSANRDAKSLCGADLVCSNSADYEKGKQLLGDAHSNATISTVLVAAGGAAVVAGAIVLLTAHPTAERTVARIVPVSHDRGAVLAVVGRF
ncbi:MAG TPA: tetratricopeptide repeat protein [Kofleriaceae bacterium]